MFSRVRDTLLRRCVMSLTNLSSGVVCSQSEPLLCGRPPGRSSQANYGTPHLICALCVPDKISQHTPNIGGKLTH